MTGTLWLRLQKPQRQPKLISGIKFEGSPIVWDQILSESSGRYTQTDLWLYRVSDLGLNTGDTVDTIFLKAKEHGLQPVPISTPFLILAQSPNILATTVVDSHWVSSCIIATDPIIGADGQRYLMELRTNSRGEITLALLGVNAFTQRHGSEVWVFAQT